MKQTQVLSYGAEGSLAERLRELAREKRFWLRETSQLAACEQAVRSSAPTILVLKLGRHLERELALLEQVHACLPATGILAVGEADNPVLAGLAWELGATCALFPPLPLEMLGDVIASMLREGAA